MDPLDEVELRGDMRATLDVAYGLARELRFEITTTEAEDSHQEGGESPGPGWEPFAVDCGLVYWRRVVRADEE